MNQLEESRKDKVAQTVGIVKLCSVIFFSMIILTISIGIYDQNTGNAGINIPRLIRDLNVLKLGIVIICMLFLVYIGWTYLTRKEKDMARFEIKIMLETIALFIVNSMLIVLTGMHESPYKFIYLFLIITTTVQFGTRYGITVACASTGFLFVMDILFSTADKVNLHFETDIVLCGVFLLSAWLIGHYAKIEEEHRKKMEGLINIDNLTGLYNHRYFQDSFNWKMDRLEGSGKPISLLMVDIDNFKNYNDMCGYLAGDEVIKRIASILKQCVRSNDIVSRYGGEEYAIMLPDTTEEQAAKVACRIRKTVSETDFYGEEKQPNGKITVSVGVSSYPGKAKTREELMKSLDDALIKAKYMERDGVETYHAILRELKDDIEKERIDLVSSLKTLISIINAKDNYTYSHTERVVNYCSKMADRLSLDERDKKILRYGAYMHDVGKIEISQYVLNKKMPLTREEWELMKSHPVRGVEIIKTVESLKDITPLIMHHHERYDGSGYPMGLAGEEIPFMARVLTVVDSFDAMTSKRPYKGAKSLSEAIDELRREQYSQFDPDISNAFIEILIEEKSMFRSLS